MCFFQVSWKTVPVFCSLIDKCLFTPVSYLGFPKGEPKVKIVLLYFFIFFLFFVFVFCFFWPSVINRRLGPKTHACLPKGPAKRGHIVADILLPMMFLGLRKLGNICCGHKMFLNRIRNILCVRDTKFVSATNVACAGKRGNICVGNNVSATVCPRLPGP